MSVRCAPPWPRIRWGVAAALVTVLGAAGCSRLPIYRSPPWRSVPLDGAGSGAAGARATEAPGCPPEARGGPVHSGVLAVRLLEDARPLAHRSARPTYLVEYGGYTGEAVTRDEMWQAPPARLVTDALTRALRVCRIFTDVRQVAAEAAPGPEVTYVLTGRLRRFRGWQAYRAEGRAPPRVLRSLGDVFVDRIEIVHRPTGRRVFVGQLGAMVKEADTLDPYAVARRAFQQGVARFLARLAEAPLEGRDLALQVSLSGGAGTVPALLAELPAGWTGVAGAPAAPKGWDGAPACRAYHLEDATRWFFHPLLGEYRPFVDLWWCPPGYRAHLTRDPDRRERFPAEFLGMGPEGDAVFLLALGQTSWPGAAEEIAAFLRLTAPPPPVLSVPP